ncbi:MAG: hypothetical protein K8T91_01810 [Planctomycetes bacterium]|nr:hypothetical protein [Planctomycetota bacterium]
MSVLTIYPYLLDPTWVFDDARTGLKEEAFVCGASEMISRLVETKEIPNAQRGFAMHFSDERFDSHDAELTWLRSDDLPFGLGGNWYQGEVSGEVMECWLCPALFHYFMRAPQTIFVRAERLPEGIDPVWRDGSHGTRYVGPNS